MSGKGQHRSLSVVDLLVSATAAHHGLVVLHDDRDVATHHPDLRQRNIRHLPH